MSTSNYTRRRTAVNLSGPRLGIVLIIAVLVVLVIGRFVIRHENKYEQLARNVTVALQNNDIDAVKKYQNAETATTITRGIVGRAADRLAPLGKLKSVKETTSKDAPDQTHDFDVAFDKGSIRETIKIDPDNKIVHFRYEKIPQ